MILILGGTTEGRLAVRVCDEASKPYYYSTKGNLQEIVCANGTRLTGAMDKQKMTSFCADNSIQLIIDAAHPFAEELHRTISEVSEESAIPVLRYERSYPEHDENVIWCDNYTDAIKHLEDSGIDNLLALTGVNTIAKLKPYWENHNCWFRILDREESHTIVAKNDFPLSKIYYYKQGEDELLLMQKLKPQAVITKESGDSGGFTEKVAAAKQLDLPIIAVKRPALSEQFISVYGEHGLRKMIEKFAPNFFDLKTGYTTGTCATAATKAALSTLLSGEEFDSISVTLSSGEWVKIPIAATIKDGEEVSCTVVKDAGDDPDVTHRKEIVSTVRLNFEQKGVHFLQGVGVGRVTLPGLGLEIGGPAINTTPRMMMKREIFKVLRHNQHKLPNLDLKIGVDVTISVPEGEELAKKTFNSKLGIEGGISIIGTSGIVRPFSSDAFIASIRREMEVAKALKCNRIIINSGAKSEKYLKKEYPDLPSQAFIHYGNFIGETIKIASDLGFKNLTMGIMLGKAVKLAEGYLDTHSKKTVMNKEFLMNIARESGCNMNTIDAISKITLARELWTIITEPKFFSLILEKCHQVCAPLLPDGEVTIWLITEDGEIVR